MAPKRSAPPPPVASSEETASGSATDESEEEIASSPPTAGPKVTAPPPQKVEEPEEASDEEEEEGDEEEEEEEEDVKPDHVSPPPATRNPPLKREESESGEEEEEEETDDEAPTPVVAPKQEAEGMGGTTTVASGEDKKQAGPFQRTWSKDDDVRILEALAAHHREHGTLPQPEDLEAALAGRLDHSGYTVKDLASKLKSLKANYTRTTRKVDQPSKDVDRRIFDLAKEVWGGGDKAAANGTVPMDFDEMCEMYPYLAEEVKVLEVNQPGLFKREFSKIDSEKARALDQKIKKQRVIQIKLEMRHHDIEKEVTKTLMDLLP